jgi:hypothetical protein
MTSFMEQLSPRWNPDSNGFHPVARYYPAMDHLLYLKEDCTYRADRVDEWLTLLWHPYKWDLVGIKLKGIRAIFRHFLTDSDRKEADVLPIAELLGLLLMSGGAEGIIEKHEMPRREELKRKYRLAFRFVANENATVLSSELRRAA